MDKQKLLKEHAEIKALLAEKLDFIFSEEYYKLSDNEKRLLSTQKTSLETNLAALSAQLWEKNLPTFDPSSSLVWLSLLSTFLGGSSFSPPPAIPPAPEKTSEETASEEKMPTTN